MIVKFTQAVPNAGMTFGFIVGGFKQVLRIFQNDRCFYCKCLFVDAPNAKRAASKDHFFPHSKGHKLSGNVILACRKCNSNKQSELPSKAAIRRFVALYEAIGAVSAIQILEDVDHEQTLTVVYSNDEP